MNSLTVMWHDRGYDAESPADPAHPAGIDADLSRGAAKTCGTPLPYPAKRCGGHVVTCAACGLSVYVTTAGRADDPRSVKVACRAP